MALRVGWAVLPAISAAMSLCACSPANGPAAENWAVPVNIPAVEKAAETPPHYGSSTEPRIRHRAVVKHLRHRQEVQQAEAEWVNPPLGAGE